MWFLYLSPRLWHAWQNWTITHSLQKHMKYMHPPFLSESQRTNFQNKTHRIQIIILKHSTKQHPRNMLASVLRPALFWQSHRLMAPSSMAASRTVASSKISFMSNDRLSTATTASMLLPWAYSEYFVRRGHLVVTCCVWKSHIFFYIT